MSRKHQFVYLAVIALVSGGAFAQQAVPAPSMGPDVNQPAAESIYKRIPAESLGFVAAKNFNELLTQFETFAGKIDMDEQIQALGPGGILPLMAALLQLGEGYNPNGGIALVVMDPEKCGIDENKLMGGGFSDFLPSFVLLMAGKSVETTFPVQTQKGEDGQLTVHLRVGNLPPLHAMMLGDYVALSPNPKALALMKTGASVEAAIPAGQKKLLAESDILLHENVTVMMPTMRKIVAKARENAETARSMPDQDAAVPDTPQKKVPMMMLTPLVDMLDDVLSLSYGLRFTEDGLMIEAAVDYKPNSALAKLAASYIPTDKPLINRLPNLPYVLAGGMVHTHNPEYVRLMIKTMEMLLATGDLEMPADLKERMTTLGEQLGEEVTAVQIVGGAPKDKGVFGLGMVVECRDAEKIKKLLPHKAELLTELVQKTVAVKKEELAELSFTYVEGVETVGETSVDAVVVDSKKLRELDEEKAGKLSITLGEDKFRILVAKADDKTLVVTLGGATDFLSAVLEAARNGGTIPSDPGVTRVLAKLPRQRVAELVFSPKNLFDTIQAGMKKLGEKSDLPEDFAFEGDAPLAMISTVQGTTGRAMLYIPASAIKDFVHWKQAEDAAKAAATPGAIPPAASAPASAPAEGNSDF